jgi:hypothetical protein
MVRGIRTLGTKGLLASFFERQEPPTELELASGRIIAVRPVKSANINKILSQLTLARRTHHTSFYF